MKPLLISAIVVMVFMIGCNIEENSTRTELNYTTTFILLPFLSLALYAITHLKEITNHEHRD